MAQKVSFKQFIIALDENVNEGVPTVWSKKFMNIAPENEEQSDYADEDQEDTDDMEQSDIDDSEADDFEGGDELDGEFDGEEESDTPNRQGVIRTVDGAHLVYKRQDEDGAYEELWIYKTNKDLKDDLEIRRDILSATDIPAQKMKSEDGEQQYTLWTVGNVQFMHISGLPQ